MRDYLALKHLIFCNLKKKKILASFEEYSCLVFLPFVLFTDVLQPEILPIEFKKTVMLYII